MTSFTTRRKALQTGGAALTVYLLPCDAPRAWSRHVEATRVPKDSSLAALERELLERCRDFIRLDSAYDKSEDVRHIYDDAYKAIVDTAKWYHWTRESDPAETRNDAWVHEVYPDDIAWVLRREPPINGLSDAFVELQSQFHNRLGALAEWSATPTTDWNSRQEKLRSIGKVTSPFRLVRQALWGAHAKTKADRALKRRAIEYGHCGRGGTIAKALHATNHPSAPSRDHLAMRIALEKKHVPFGPDYRPDWRDWQSIYGR